MMKNIIKYLCVMCLMCVTAAMAQSEPSHTNPQLTVQLKSNGDVILAIPQSLLGSELLFSSKVVHLSEQKDISAGQTYLDPYIFTLVERDGGVAMLRSTNKREKGEEAQYIGAAFERNNVKPTQTTFKIISKKDGVIHINIKELFTPLKRYNNPLPKINAGSLHRNSGVSEVYNIENGVSVVTDLYYEGISIPFCARLVSFIYVAPEVMERRMEDNRVGYFASDVTVFDDMKTSKSSFIHRWRVEPKEGDIDRYLQGELVEPKRKIVFAFDDATPDFIKKHAAKGITDWNRAFEKIGFKSVIEVRELAPNEELKDSRINIFRYIPTDKSNAQGVMRVDPRSGEVLSADIFMYSNVISLLKQWRFISTAAADEKARNYANMPDEVVGEMVRYVAAHEMGHVLGLTHNMIASAARSIDELKSVTKERGTTASIMDYARYNYVAPIASAAKGVSMSPPILGEYDYYAIEYGYRYLADNIDDKEWLSNFILKHTNNKVYRYHRGETAAITGNPYITTDVLSDNPIEATRAAISNLKYTVDNFVKWNYSEGDTYDVIEMLYKEIVDSYTARLNNVLSYVGGEYYINGVMGEYDSNHSHISTEEQLQALNLYLEGIVGMYDQLYNEEVYKAIGNQRDYIVEKLTRSMGNIFSPNYMSQVEDGIEVEQLFKMFTKAIFKNRGSFDSKYIEQLQAIYVGCLKKLSAESKVTPSTLTATKELNKIVKKL